MASGDTWLNAFIGAVVTVLVSFVPFSPVLGGAVAAYLQEGDSSESLRVGALSGAIAAIPLALVFLVVGSVLAVLPFGIALSDGGGFPAAVSVFFVVAVLFVFVLALAFTVGFSALGGAIGGHVARDRKARVARDRGRGRDAGHRRELDRGRDADRPRATDRPRDVDRGADADPRSDADRTRDADRTSDADRDGDGDGDRRPSGDDGS